MLKIIRNIFKVSVPLTIGLIIVNNVLFVLENNFMLFGNLIVAFVTAVLAGFSGVLGYFIIKELHEDE